MCSTVAPKRPDHDRRPVRGLALRQRVPRSSYRVQGEVKAVERLIIDAARGSIMQLAWLSDTQTGDSLAINPKCVLMLRALSA